MWSFASNFVKPSWHVATSNLDFNTISYFVNVCTPNSCSKLLTIHLRLHNPVHQLSSTLRLPHFYITEIVYLYHLHNGFRWSLCSCSRHDSPTQQRFNPYPTAFPYGNGMVLHFYQQQESSTTKTVHKVINKGLKTYV